MLEQTSDAFGLRLFSRIFRSALGESTPELAGGPLDLITDEQQWVHEAWWRTSSTEHTSKCLEWLCIGGPFATTINNVAPVVRMHLLERVQQPEVREVLRFLAKAG